MPALEQSREAGGDLGLHIILRREGNPVLSFDREEAKSGAMAALSCYGKDVWQLIVSLGEVGADRETSCQLYLKGM
jgi:hypothetical protein